METKSVRVRCRIPGASTSISGIAFATVEVDGQKVHVSERLDAEQADRLCQLDGFERFDTPAGANLDIDRALTIVKAATVAKGPTGPDRRDKRIEELQAANQALSNDLVQVNQEVERLSKKVSELGGKDKDQLAGEVAKLREQLAAAEKPDGKGKKGKEPDPPKDHSAAPPAP